MDNSSESAAAQGPSLDGKKSFLSTYKIPLLSLVLFGSVVMHALYPQIFSLGIKRNKYYRFKNDTLGFFISDPTFFSHNTAESAETKLIEMFPENVRPNAKLAVKPVLSLCEKYEVDPFWVLSVMWAESHFKQEATSKKGARGLMQLMPSTYKETYGFMREKAVAFESDRGEEYLRYHYPDAYYQLGYSKLVAKLRHLEVGIYYLRSLLVAFEQNHFYATVAYNMGPSWTKGQLRNNLPVEQNNHYLNKVMKNYLHMSRALGNYPYVSFIPGT